MKVPGIVAEMIDHWTAFGNRGPQRIYLDPENSESPFVVRGVPSVLKSLEAGRPVYQRRASLPESAQRFLPRGGLLDWFEVTPGDIVRRVDRPPARHGRSAAQNPESGEQHGA